MTEPKIIEFRLDRCTSLSGKATIAFHYGADEAGNFAVRVSSTSGGGFFSNEWVPLDHVIQALRSCKGPLSSGTLHRLFRGKSVNTAGFLLAALKHEGAVKPVDGKSRRYQLGDLDAYLARVHTAAEAKKAAELKWRNRTPRKKAIPRQVQARG